MELPTSYTIKMNEHHISAKQRMSSVFVCCTVCDQLYCQTHRSSEVCSDGCKKRRATLYVIKRDRKKGVGHRKYFISKFSDLSRFRVVMPNGQVFDYSKRSKPYIPKPKAVSCIDCGRFWYIADYNSAKRCKQCNAISGSKAHAIKKRAMYQQMIGEGYSYYKRERYSNKRRAERFGCEYQLGISIDALTAKSNNQCIECGIELQRHAGGWHPEGATIGHIIPMSLGGGHIWSNVQAECHACNIWKGNRETEVDWDDVAMA